MTTPIPHVDIANEKERLNVNLAILREVEAAEAIRLQTKRRIATTNKIYTNAGMLVLSRINNPVISEDLPAQRTIFVSSFMLEDIFGPELWARMSYVLTPMHGMERDARAKGTTRLPKNLFKVVETCTAQA
eukprot:jgi/Tetstr1/431616/TSEL_021146.t1